MSEIFEINDWEKTVKSITEGTLIFYLFDKLIFGVLKDGNIIVQNNVSIDSSQIVKLRAFNEYQEILIVKTSAGYQVRKRLDANLKEAEDYIDTDEMLWGTTGESDGEYTRLFEDRGTEMSIPGEFNDIKPDNRVYVTIRNYIEPNDIGQVGIVDARFVKFK